MEVGPGERSDLPVPVTGGPATVIGLLIAVEAQLLTVSGQLRVSGTGTAFGSLFLGMSLTPSLLPRTWLAQGMISGFSAAFGYGLGVSATCARTRLPTGPLLGDRWRMPGDRWRLPAGRRGTGARATGRRALTGGCVVLLGLSLHESAVSQRELSLVMGEPPPATLPAYVGVLALAAAVLVGTVALVRGLRAAVGWLAGWARRRVPPGPAQVLAVAVTLLAAGLLAQNLVVQGVLSTASAISERMNDSLGPTPARPLLPDRSGSPQSLVGWDSLGREGRIFVAGGPTTGQLQRFSGVPARQPVRVYVGRRSAPTFAEAAALAVRELDRTGAASRAVLCVVTTTGTGWIDPYLAAALEYQYDGNTALVGMQYSYLPSAISFLTERSRVAQAGRELFDRVHAWWAALPTGNRPKLLVFGESLGSLGSESAFADLDDARARADGVLWAGPTNANPVWRQVVSHRDPGSTQVAPVYRQGSQVRFASRAQDLSRPAGPWRFPRVVYLQNPSDPVTWWSPDLLVHRPDWLAEPRGHDVLPAMQWYPVVTFLQVTADLALAYGAPQGHGHRFHAASVWAWAAVADPPGWTPSDSERLTRLLGK